MSENKLVGSLNLRTIDIDPTRIRPVINANETFSNTYGLATAHGSVITWKNINIRTCLGEFYNKYNSFNLKLTSVQLKHNNISSLADCQMMIYMPGLPFSSGSSYNTRLGPTNQAVIGCADFLQIASNVGKTTSLLSSVVSFDKPLQDVIDITSELKNSAPTTETLSVRNGYTEKTEYTMPHFSIICDIYGIDD